MPNRSRYCFVKGPELLNILRASKTPIKWLWSTDKPAIIAPEMAVIIAKSNPHVGKINATGRVLYIKLIPTKQPLRVDTYQDDRAVLKYQTDKRSVPTKVKNKETADLWNRLLALNPAPASWRNS
jgi:hypothetical protein